MLPHKMSALPTGWMNEQSCRYQQRPGDVEIQSLPIECVDQQRFGKNDRGALKVDCLPAVIT